MALEDAMELRAVMARWEVTRARWALNPAEESALLGGTGFEGSVAEPASWQAVRLERRMRLLVELGDGLELLMRGEAEIRRWLRRPMRGIGLCRPIDVMEESTEWIRRLRDAVRDFLP